LQLRLGGVEDALLLAGLDVPQAQGAVALRPAAARQQVLAILREGGDADRPLVRFQQAERPRLALPDLDQAVAAQRVQLPAARPLRETPTARLASSSSS